MFKKSCNCGELCCLTIDIMLHFSIFATYEI